MEPLQHLIWPRGGKKKNIIRYRYIYILRFCDGVVVDKAEDFHSTQGCCKRLKNHSHVCYTFVVVSSQATFLE